MGLLGYDRGRFLGTQLRTPETANDEDLPIVSLHRFVRHPLYSGLSRVLWGHAQTELAHEAALWGSVYLVIGAGFEERRLIDRYGDACRTYTAHVPAFVP